MSHAIEHGAGVSVTERSARARSCRFSAAAASRDCSARRIADRSWGAVAVKAWGTNLRCRASATDASRWAVSAVSTVALRTSMAPVARAAWTTGAPRSAVASSTFSSADRRETPSRAATSSPTNSTSRLDTARRLISARATACAADAQEIIRSQPATTSSSAASSTCRTSWSASGSQLSSAPSRTAERGTAESRTAEVRTAGSRTADSSSAGSRTAGSRTAESWRAAARRRPGGVPARAAASGCRASHRSNICSA